MVSTGMTSIERVQAAIDLRTPGRVPVDLHNFQPAAYATGKPLADVFQDGELLAQAMLDAWREFGHDMILLENGTACNAQACGVEVSYREDAAPAAHKPLIKSLEEGADLQVPDPYTTFPMCEISRPRGFYRRRSVTRYGFVREPIRVPWTWQPKFAVCQSS